MNTAPLFHRSVFSLAAVVLLAPAALAAGEAAPPMAFELIQFGAALLAFTVTLGIAAKLVWPKILQGLDARENKILSEIENAERARSEAERAQQEYADELAKARSEAAKMIEEAKAEAMRAAADLKSQNEAELTSMKASARQQIEAAQKAAIEEIYREAGTVAIAVAEKILQRQVNETDQQRLVEETLGEITREYAGHA